MVIFQFFKKVYQPSQQKKWLIVFCLNTLLLLYLTLMPPSNHQIGYQHIDKVFHFIGFGSFAFFCKLAFVRLSNLWALITSSALGIIVEIVQSLLPYRSFSLADMLSNIAGVVTALAFLHFTKKRVDSTN